MNRTPLAGSGKEARLKLAGMLKELAAETADLADPHAKPRSLADAIDDVDTVLNTINQILHPQSGTPVSQ